MLIFNQDIIIHDNKFIKLLSYYNLEYQNNMVNFLSPSNYREEYEEGKFELMPWHFWTEE